MSTPEQDQQLGKLLYERLLDLAKDQQEGMPRRGQWRPYPYAKEEELRSVYALLGQAAFEVFEELANKG